MSGFMDACRASTGGKSHAGEQRRRPQWLWRVAALVARNANVQDLTPFSSWSRKGNLSELSFWRKRSAREIELIAAPMFATPILSSEDAASVPGANDRASLRRAERWFACLIAVSLVALRVVYAFVYRVDSDEPQHLHVVWGWANGLLQYRFSLLGQLRRKSLPGSKEHFCLRRFDDFLPEEWTGGGQRPS